MLIFAIIYVSKTIQSVSLEPTERMHHIIFYDVNYSMMKEEFSDMHPAWFPLLFCMVVMMLIMTKSDNSVFFDNVPTFILHAGRLN